MTQTVDVVVVAADRGSAHVTLQVTRELLLMGCSVHAVVRGPAFAIFNEVLSGVIPITNAAGSFHPHLFFKGCAPQILVSGISTISPENPKDFEAGMRIAARSLGIKVALIEDGPGVAKRVLLGESLDFVACANEVSADMARERFPEAQIEVGGDIGVRTVIVPASVSVRLAEIRRYHPRILVLTESISERSGPEPAESMIRLVIECIKRTKTRWAIIPRFHPKWESAGYWVRWNILLYEVLDRVFTVDTPSIDPLAACADATGSGFSTALSTAVANGREAIVFGTPNMYPVLDEYWGFSEVPLVTMGCAHKVLIPTDLDTVVDHPISVVDRAKLVQFNRELITKKLVSLF